MGDKTAIQWTDATWNPVRGCSRVSEGCRNCYAERVASRFSGPGMPYEGLAANGKWTGKARLIESALDQPLRWSRPRRIFVNSMSDLFHESLAFDDILRVFEVMHKAQHHTFQVLTKRPARALEFVANYGLTPLPHLGGRTQSGERWPDNVWFGVSTENQATADERIPLALQVPAPAIFLSCEPLLGSIELRLPRACAARIGWVIAGGESGPGARPMHIDWARSLRDQCAAAGVAYFHKQNGEWQDGSNRHGPNRIVLNNGRVLASTDEASADERDRWPKLLPRAMARVGKCAAGRMLDGREHSEFPA